MKEENFEELKQQLEEYKAEKERVRKLVGQIGGKKGSKLHTLFNQIFILLIILVFILSGIFQKISYSIGMELILVFFCAKIMWMIYEQHKIDHFQFWMLTTLELKSNEMDKKLWKILKKLEGENEKNKKD